MNPNPPQASLSSGNTATNPASGNNNNPKQPSSNTEPTTAPQSTTISINPFENNNSSSGRFVTQGRKVGLIAARRTGRVRGSNLTQQNSNIEPTALSQDTPPSSNPFENNNSSSIFAQNEVRDSRARDLRDSLETSKFIARAQRFGQITTRGASEVERGANSHERPNLEQFFQGTDNHIGQSHVHEFRESFFYGGRMQAKFCCITGTIKNHCLDEMRAKDHFNLKQNLLSPEKKQLVDILIARNEQQHPRISELSSRNLEVNQGIGASQSINPVFGCGMQASGSLFANPQSILGHNNQIKQDQSNTIENLQGTQTVIQKGEGVTQIQHKKTVPKKSIQPVQQLTAVETSQEDDDGEFVQQTVMSTPGSFGYEMNKMLFFSGLSQVMEKHNLTVPEDVLDKTDFCTKFMEFLGQYNINLPTENVPQFELNSITTLMKK